MQTPRIRGAAFAAILFFSCLLPAQDTAGKITGIVTDPSGAVVANAKVIVTNVATGIAHDTLSKSSGSYQVLQLPIGLYRVTAEAPGFEKITVDSKTPLEINQTLRIDVQLRVGTITSSVTVEGQPTQVETENATIGATVTGQAIFELPLNGRNTLDLVKTQPGVTPSGPDSTAAGSYSIGGMRADSVTYLLDGGMNNDLLNNGVVANPNPDAVAEFKVLESNYNAEYGRNAGGIVSVVTKSGTNQLHGTAYDYVRNNFFDANSFFNNQQGLAVPVLKRNQFGGSVGGPIIVPKLINGRDKLFFFFSYEGQRQTQLDTSLGKINTFTPAEANGDFSQSPGAGLVADFLSAHPYYQPNPNLAAQGIIDPSRIDPVAKAYFQNGLIPTSPSGFLFPQAPATNNYNQYLGKFDYNATAKDTISGTFTANDNPQLDPFGSSVVGYPSTNGITTYSGSVSYMHTFSPALLNEFRATVQRLHNLQDVPARSLPNAAQLGTSIIQDDPVGPPRIYFEGTNLDIGFSTQGPTNEYDTTGALYDNVSWTKGSHNWKFGFYFSPYQNNTDYDYHVTGEYYLYGPDTYVGSGVDLADFLMGNPDEYLQYPKSPSNIRTHQYAGFAQDAWKASKRLTLTLGLRYEYSSPKYDTKRRSFSFIPGLQSQRFPNSPPGLVYPGDPGAPTGANFPDKNDWAPRFGFAYDVFGDSKTSIRGGFGMFYDVLKGEDSLQFNGQPPFFSYADIYPTGASDGVGHSGLQNPFAAAGAINPFPSKPPAKDINFLDSGFLPFGGGSLYFVDPHLRTPYVFQYNLSVQQQLAANMTLEVAYLGSTAHKLTGVVDVNPFLHGTNNRLYNSDPDNPTYSYLNQFENVSNASYNAMTVNLRRTVASLGDWGSLFYTLGYTWSHEIDNVSGYKERNYKVPYYNHNQFRASGDGDVRQIVTLSGGWELPFQHLLPQLPKLLTSGWSLYPILTIRSGFPLDVYANLNTSLSNPGPSGAGDAGLVRADLTGNTVSTLNPATFQTLANPNNSDTTASGNYYFNPASYSVSRIYALNAIAKDNAANLPYFTYGSSPRNGLRGPGQTNLDIALSKHFRFGEGRKDLELRMDAFNVFNHTQFRSPDIYATDSTFGQISTTYDPRILQIALHLAF